LIACTDPAASPAPSHRAPRAADPEDPMRVTDATRKLGLTVCRGTAVMLVAPTNGMEEIENPFLQQES